MFPSKVSACFHAAVTFSRCFSIAALNVPKRDVLHLSRLLTDKDAQAVPEISTEMQITIILRNLLLL